MKELRTLVGDEHVITDPTTLEEACTSWREGRFGDAVAIVRPGTVEELSKVVAYCVREKIGIVIQGGKTSMTGGSTPAVGIPNQIIVQTKRLNKIATPRLDSCTVAVEAGVTLFEANDALQAHGLKIALGLGIGGVAQLGGNIATNAGGTEAFRVGRAGDLVTELTVVLPREKDNVVTLTRDTPGRFAMADFIGSEGVFGVIASAVFKLQPLPVKKQVAFVTTDDLTQLKALKESLGKHAPGRLNAIERIDRRAFELSLDNLKYKGEVVSDFFLRLLAEYNFIVEIDTINANDDLTQIMQNALKGFTHHICDDADGEELWKTRKVNISEGIRRLCTDTGSQTVAFDLSLPVQDEGVFPTPELVKDLNAEVVGVDYVQFGHSGNNGIHFDLIVPEQTSKAKIDKLKDLVFEHIVSRKGSISAEHGLGHTKREAFAKYYPDSAAALSALKMVYDPNNILNPGQINN